MEVTLWSIGLLSHVNLSVLELLNLMLSIWDGGRCFPDWVEDSGSLNWGWVSGNWVWGWWKWGSPCGGSTLAGGDDGIAQIIIEGNLLSVSRRIQLKGALYLLEDFLAVGKLDPSSSNSGSSFGGGHSERLLVGLKLNKLRIIGLSLLKLLNLVRKVLISIHTCGEAGISFHGGGGSDKESDGVR